VTTIVNPTARSSGLTYQQLLDTDSRPVPDVLRAESPFDGGDADIPKAHYLSREFHELEKERLWRRTWQMVCRETEVANVGDTVVYDIADLGFIVVRSSPTEIRAFYNACLHRGRQIKDFDGPNHELRCPFHGFCWNLDGSLKQVPCEWDFPHVRARHDATREFDLPQVRVATWGGFVFINPDPDAIPFEEHIGDLSWHFARWPLDKRYKSAHVAKVMRANWKLVQEAFMEAYHVVATHPQLLPGIGDANSQYDAWGTFSRAITPNGTPSPHIRFEPSEQQMLDSMLDRRLDADPFVVVPDGMTARHVTGENGRRMLAPLIGAEDADRLTDAELTDSFYYTLFPNLHPWGAYNRITYRFRPNGDDHTTSIMECMFLAPFDESEGRPPDAPIHWLGADDDWTEAEELGLLAKVFNQDTFNLPKVQKGLSSLQKDITGARYQETKIRHWHSLYRAQLGVSPG
jgi:phenylpropionate dioxygenase-like ring-hydroxylating dioxygenase large terminal subunit